MLKNNMSIDMIVGNTAEMSLFNIQASCSNFSVQITRENEVANRYRGRMVHYMKRVWSRGTQHRYRDLLAKNYFFQINSTYRLEFFKINIITQNVIINCDKQFYLFDFDLFEYIFLNEYNTFNIIITFKNL